MNITRIHQMWSDLCERQKSLPQIRDNSKVTSHGPVHRDSIPEKCLQYSKVQFSPERAMKA
jgi:hypothetical protein